MLQFTFILLRQSFFSLQLCDNAAVWGLFVLVDGGSLVV